MRVGKHSGGCTLTRGGKTYTWAKDDSVINVPADLGDELLNIRSADFFQPDSEPQQDTPVTEPAPAAEKTVTEPAPVAKAAVTEKDAAAK